MQRIIQTALVLSVIVAGLQSCSQPTPNKVIHTIGFDWLEGCETGKGDCKPILLVRQSISDSIRLIFPSGGTESDVYLYKISLDKPLLHDQKWSGQGRPVLDLTGLPDGSYTAHMLSCAVGGIFSVIIKTS
jgi:hypothetical protein